MALAQSSKSQYNPLAPPKPIPKLTTKDIFGFDPSAKNVISESLAKSRAGGTGGDSSVPQPTKQEIQTATKTAQQEAQKEISKTPYQTEEQRVATKFYAKGIPASLIGGEIGGYVRQLEKQEPAYISQRAPQIAQEQALLRSGFESVDEDIYQKEVSSEYKPVSTLSAFESPTGFRGFLFRLGQRIEQKEIQQLYEPFIITGAQISGLQFVRNIGGFFSPPSFTELRQIPSNIIGVIKDPMDFGESIGTSLQRTPTAGFTSIAMIGAFGSIKTGKNILTIQPTKPTITSIIGVEQKIVRGKILTGIITRTDPLVGSELPRFGVAAGLTTTKKQIGDLSFTETIVKGTQTGQMIIGTEPIFEREFSGLVRGVSTKLPITGRKLIAKGEAGTIFEEKTFKGTGGLIFGKTIVSSNLEKVSLGLSKQYEKYQFLGAGFSVSAGKQGRAIFGKTKTYPFGITSLKEGGALDIYEGFIFKQPRIKPQTSISQGYSSKTFNRQQFFQITPDIQKIASVYSSSLPKIQTGISIPTSGLQFPLLFEGLKTGIQTIEQPLIYPPMKSERNIFQQRTELKQIIKPLQIERTGFLPATRQRLIHSESFKFMETTVLRQFQLQPPKLTPRFGERFISPPSTPSITPFMTPIRFTFRFPPFPPFLRGGELTERAVGRISKGRKQRRQPSLFALEVGIVEARPRPLETTPFQLRPILARQRLRKR